jgi:shikimate dehydrogenase
VLQLGAGGGGAATAHALLELGTRELLICDREVARSAALVRSLRQVGGARCAEAISDVPSVLAGVVGVVNATPMGMATDPLAPFDTSLLLPSQWVADIVYFPLETELLKSARARGCRTLDGSGMAVYQAAAAFEIFTGHPANRARMRRSFLEYTPTPIPPAD